jgi:hypothetical protein
VNSQRKQFSRILKEDSTDKRVLMQAIRIKKLIVQIISSMELKAVALER